MKYLLCWAIIPALWALGGWRWRYWRRAGVPLIFLLLTFPVIKWWSILMAGLVFGSLTLPYGDEPTDLPRWLCGLLYAIPLGIIVYFTHKWLLFALSLVISSIGSHLVNNRLNTLNFPFKDRITEFLTALCAYCLVLWMI